MTARESSVRPSPACGGSNTQTLSERIAQWVGGEIYDGIPRWSRDIATSLARLTASSLAANKDPARSWMCDSRDFLRLGFNPGIEPLCATSTLSWPPAVNMLQCALKRLGQRPAENPMDSSRGAALAEMMTSGHLHGTTREKIWGHAGSEEPTALTALIALVKRWQQLLLVSANPTGGWQTSPTADRRHWSGVIASVGMQASPRVSTSHT
ncbi:hypothetical protein BO94DRAFT_140455 [Aspergillus sclerotioniger CBS 115572]|uniref:Uncharacterized protein n=1 Tax=Aspergillus sclerotioniger CBS 115572 TaxID=1450535 RepID=A0A317XC61_9EURO|nr:hypothetical protein BO94DRAFT_140455 [Aspergillus sclerotioniger CBS 115572]PWY95925.1 hypothetical protein BO94DRAFT_140455 [Aspergillus sclerotioniger CBS 115572]